MAHDRADGDEFAMTHEFLAMLLGVRWSGVSTAARILQRAQFIRYERHHIEITDRLSLERDLRMLRHHPPGLRPPVRARQELQGNLPPLSPSPLPPS
jgi:hypothetical protein